jgi:F-type H+-transporting ATPase subunit gamma
VETQQSLEQAIRVARELQSVVRTMKAMAAVGIRQFEKAARTLAAYDAIIERGFQIVLRDQRIEPVPAGRGSFGAVVFGSDQGMCGQFNEQIAAFFDRQIRAEGEDPGALHLAAPGARGAAQLERYGYRVDRVFALPAAVERIDAAVAALALEVERWQAADGVTRIRVFHHRQRGGASYAPQAVDLMPVDTAWLRSIAGRPWRTRVIPAYLMDRGRLFSLLVRQYLYVMLFRAFADSLAAENAARLAAMQAAERNIDERLRDLSLAFHQERQTAITTELLDIVAGFEALEDTI